MASPSLLISEHENLLTVQDEPLYEIVNGQRVELPPMSAYATWIASRLHGRLWPYAEDKGLGVSVAEMLFVLNAEHNLRRRPDVAFVSTARWPLDRALPVLLQDLRHHKTASRREGGRSGALPPRHW
jgi:Uma2 family endonuclease